MGCQENNCWLVQTASGWQKLDDKMQEDKRKVPPKAFSSSNKRILRVEEL